MKAYAGFKFKEDYSDRAFIESICRAIESAGIKTVVMVRDYEGWGQTRIAPGDMMPIAFRAIDDCDIVIIEFSEKGTGLGIEAGYAYAKGKPVLVIAREGAEISETLEGIASRVMFYRKPEDIQRSLEDSGIMDA
ncbi:MAG: nucleoside 2-deoxyribosyltransferase [bacterium]